MCTKNTYHISLNNSSPLINHHPQIIAPLIAPTPLSIFSFFYPLHVTLKWNLIRGPFLERPGNFSGPKSNIQIEIKRIRARVLARKLLHFVLLTDSFIMLDAKLLKPRSLM